MSNSTETQRKPIKDRLGGEKSLPIRLVRESLWETDNPFIKLCRTYPGQIVIAVITYYLFKQVLGAWLMNVLISWALNSNIVPEKALLATVTYSDIIMLAAFLLFMKFAERRSFAAMGFISRKALRNILFGLLAGVCTFAVSVGLTVLISGGHFGWAGTMTPGFFVYAFLGIMVSASAEEVNGRSYIFLSVSRNFPEWLAALTSGLFFGAIHLTNSGWTVTSTINSALVGIIFCFTVLLVEDVWFACAAHTTWNFSQGFIFGLPVSGNDVGGSFFSTTITTENELLSGGTYGIESNIITTCLFLIVIAVLLVLLKKKAAKQAAA